MKNSNVLIKFLGKIPSEKINTSEGIKKFNSENEIEVSVGLALQLVDNVNWSCKEDLKKLSKKFFEQNEQILGNEIIDENDTEDTEDTEDTDDVDDVDEETMEEKVDDDEEESESMGDDETRQLIKRIPKMKYLDLVECAEEAGIDVSKYSKKEIIKLKRDLIKVLKGK